MEKINEKVSGKLLISIFATCLIAFCGLLTETAVNITFPTLMNEFGVTTTTIQWLTTGNLLVVAMITPLSSFFQRRFKLKNLFICGALIFLIGTIIGATAESFTMLLLARLIQGVAMGLSVPLGFSIIIGQVPGAKRGTFMGIGALVTAAAPALGPTFGGIINQMIGWRFIFIIQIPFILLALVAGIATIKQVTKTEKVPTDIIGMILVMITFIFLVYGFSNLTEISTNLLKEVIIFIIGIIAFVLFVKHCSNTENALINMEIFKYKSFNAHLLAYFILNVVLLGLAFLLPNYLQICLNVNSMNSGMVMLPGALLNALMAPFGGIMLDKLGAKKPLLCGGIFMVIAIAIMAVFGRNLPVMVLTLAYVIYGIGCGISFGNTMANGLGKLPVQITSYGNTAFNTLLQFSGAVGTSLVSTIVAFSQNSSSTDSYEIKTAIGSGYGFLFLLILIIICFLLQIVGVKDKEELAK